MTRCPISRAAAIGVVWMCLTPLGSPVEPEVYIQNATSSDNVGAVKGWRSAFQKIGEIVHVAAGGTRLRSWSPPDENNGAQVRQAVEHGNERLGECLGERRCDDDGGGAAVAQDVGVLLGRQQGVERQCDNAGAHRAPKGDRKVDAVIKQQREAFLGLDPEIVQRRRKTAGARLQFAVAQRTFGVDECDFVAKTARDLGIDEVRYGIVRPTLRKSSSIEWRPPLVVSATTERRKRLSRFFVRLVRVARG